MKMTLVLLLVAIPVACPMAGARQNATPGEIAHGTINVILANKNGIVALTDSMLTVTSPSGEMRQSPDPVQKLFKLDDHSVCTIAGFVFAGGPIPQTYTDTRAIIRDYVSHLGLHPDIGIQEKLTTLGYLFRSYLTQIARVRAAAGEQTPVDDYIFVLTVAGYDSDGAARVGQMTLSTEPADSMFLQSEIGRSEITEVRSNLVWKLAGITDVAERLLKDTSGKTDRALAIYAESLKKDNGQSLGLEDMKKIASTLASQTARSYPGVGGANQVAVLQKGHITDIEQASFPEPPKKPPMFMIYMADTSPGTGPFASIGVPTLYLANRFEKGQIQLDGLYFSRNDFVSNVFLYDGGFTYLDETNHFEGCRLLLGPHAKLDSRTVRRLVDGFEWSGGVYQVIRAPRAGGPTPMAPASH